MGLLQYAQDYDEKAVCSYYGNDGDTDPTSFSYKWMDAIYPYIKSEQIFVCPSDSTSLPFKLNATGRNYGSYAGNQYYGRRWRSDGRSEGERYPVIVEL